ncbi:MAG: carboxypeptidase-like regulatory domain-containing protein [Thermodesulfobacteriota bacterium]|nr:carboxypeptidase-like regulatory domain-containing protein [Thermodesulfobacteriota bacterium]
MSKLPTDTTADSYYGTKTTYKLWIYRPAAVINGFIDGIITHGDTGRPVEGVIISTLFSEGITESDGFYFMGCPAGTIGVKAEKPGFHDFYTTIEMGENQRCQLDISMNPKSSCQSSYETVQWGERGGDSYYCVDICDLQGNVYPGLSAVECGEYLNTWSPKHYINIILGIPDTTLSGLQFMWKIWSRSGYGGEGFEGIITVP